MAMTTPLARSRIAAPILRQQEALDASEACIGGKAAGLARVTRAGARVPPWAVLTAEAFDEHLRAAELPILIDRELAAVWGREAGDPVLRRELDRVSNLFHARLAVVPLPPELEDALGAAVAELGGVGIAVRSSAVGEDSTLHSYAGQYDSFLNLHSASDVAAAVRCCWASALSARALAYRHRAGERPNGPRMAVILQRMVASRVSGVLFTADPRTGRRDRALISACWGLGEGLVSGRCDADELLVDEALQVVHETVGHKERAVVADRTGAGTREADVADARRDARALTREEAAEIVREGRRLASAFSAPQDIEWALEGDTLFILQARPITALPVPIETDAPVVVWDNSNIQESYCGVTTPLTFSFASAAYASVYEQTMRALGLPERTIAEHRPMLRRLLGILNGRIYYNIGNWHRGLLLLPSFGRNKSDMETMMGLEEPVDFVVDERLGAVERLRRLPRLTRTFFRLMRRFHRLPGDAGRWLARFDRIVATVDRRSLEHGSLSALGATLVRLRAELVERWETPIVNDFFVMMSSGRLRRLVQRLAPEQAALIPDLLAGIDDLASARPPRELMYLAAAARGDAGIAAVLGATDAADALSELRRHHADFARKLDAWLDAYGDRAMGELKLETISLRQEPAFVIRVLRSWLSRPDLDPDDLARREGERHARAVAAVSARLGPWDRFRLRRAHSAARRGIAARESMRLARTRLFGLFRDVYLAIGARLHEAGRLDAPRDVFYLTVEEIDGYLGGAAVSAELASIARARLAEYRAYEGVEMPNRVETRGAPYHANVLPGRRQQTVPADDVLRGSAVSAGIAEGRAAVVTSPRDEVDMNGRVLVAMRTDPGWAPLFPAASAILVERGSSLSHSAVLARELGIPAVVGIPGLVAALRDGERLRVDGGAGTVTRLEAA